MLNNDSMFSRAQRIVAAKICFLVFVSKMLISATPMFVNVLDKGTVLQIVMQLEIELLSNTTNSTASEDLHEHGVKVFNPHSIDYMGFNPTTENSAKARSFLKNEKDICSFHPKVPTPPPNC